MTQEEKLQFKFKYDKMLDDVFFTSKFKQYIVEKCKHCPNGLTIDANITRLYNSWLEFRQQSERASSS